MKLISRIILYPLCVYAAVWCWNGFRDRYESIQLDRYSVELEDRKEAPVEGDGGETGGSDTAYDLEEVNRMLTNSASAQSGFQSIIFWAIIALAPRLTCYWRLLPVRPRRSA